MKNFFSGLEETSDVKTLRLASNFVTPFFLFALLAAPSVYFLSRFPPLWRDSDGFYQIATKPNYLQILHWPPLYCLCARIPILVGNWIAAWSSHSPLGMNSFDEPGLTEPGLFALVLVQHVLLVAGLLTACLGVCTRVSTRIGFGFLLASQAWLYAFAQCVGSEAFGHLFGLLAITAAIAWMRRQCGGMLIDCLLLLALACAVLARHINLLLILLAPGWCCCSLLVALVRGGSERRTLCLRLLRRFLRATVIGLLALGTAYLVTLACCSFYHVPYRSRAGYVFQWRLNYLSGLSPTERITRFTRLKRDLHDPAIDYGINALEDSTANGRPWQTELLSQAIFRWFQENTKLPFRQQAYEMDNRLNRICRWFLFSRDQKLYSSILQDTIRSLEFSPAEIAREPFVCTDALIGMLKRDQLAPIRSLASLQRPLGAYEEEWRRSWYCNLWRDSPIFWFGLAALGFGLVDLLTDRRSLETLLVVSILLVCAVAVALANSTATFLSARFDGPTCLLFLAALGYSIDQVIARRNIRSSN